MSFCQSLHNEEGNTFTNIKINTKETEVEGWKYIDDDDDPDSISLRQVPKHTLVYEITGPMFFAAADKFMQISTDTGIKVVILRMRSVPAMDITALHSLEVILENCKKRGITLVLSHVNEQPKQMMVKAGFDQRVGEENFVSHIDEAIALAESIDR